MHMPRPTFVLTRSIAALIAASATSLALDNVWTGAASTDWNDPTNWAQGRVPSNPSPAPDGFDDARINTSTGNIATITANIPNMRDIIVGRDAGNSGLVNHRSGTATGSGWFYVGQFGGTGTYNLADTTTTGGVVTGFGTGSGSMSFGQVRVGVDGGAIGTLRINTTGTLTSGGDILVGVNGTGVVKIDAGTVNRTGGWSVFGQNAGSSGTLNMSGGTVTTSNNQTILGLGGGTGTFAMTGGTYSEGGEFWVGNDGGSTGNMTVSGGTVNVGNWFAVGRNGSTGFLTINGTGVVQKTNLNGFLEIGNNGASNGTVNLDGGSLAVNRIVTGGGTSTFNFNGGTLKATSSDGNYMQGLTNAFVKAGGAVFDSNGFTPTIGQSLNEDPLSTGGGFTKIGAGSVTLSSFNTYTGMTTVNGGTLIITGTNNSGAGATINSGGTLAFGNGGGSGMIDGNVSVVSGGALTFNRNDDFTYPANISGAGTVNKNGPNTLTIGGSTAGFTGTTNVNAGALILDLTQGGTVAVNSGGRLVPLANATGALTVGALSLNTNSTMDFEFGAGPTNDVIVVSNSGGLSFGSAFTLNFYDVAAASAFSTNGVYTLFDYTGTFTGSLSNLVVGNPVAGKGYALTNDVGSTSIRLTISTVVLSEWNIAGGGLWSVAGNWNPPVVPNVVSAEAVFGMAISAPSTIDMNGNKTVGKLSFDNTNSYTIGGAGTLTLDNGATASTVTVNDTSLTGGSHFINVPITATGNLSVTTASGTSIQFGNLGGGNGLTTNGAGTVTLNGAGTYSTTTVNGGTLNVGTGSTTGSLGTGAVVLGVGTALGFNRSDAITVSNNISGGGSLNQNGAGTLTYTGTATYTGATILNAGTFTNQGTINGTTSLIVGNAGGTATLNLPTGSTTTVAGLTSVGTGAGTGTLNISGGTTSLVDMHVAAGGAGAVTVSGTAAVTATGHVNVGDGGSPATFNQTAGTMTVNSWTAIGLGSSGQFDVSGGTYNANGGLEVGADSVGTLNLSGTGAINSNGNFEVPSRNGGAGSVATVSAGALTAAGIRIGGRDGQTAASGTLVQSGGTITSNTAVVGTVGTGTFEKSGGTTTTSNWTVVGQVAGSTGTVNMSGGTWNQNHTDFLTIGENGTGIFNMTGTALLNDQAVVDTSNRNTNKGNVIVGRNSGGDGTWNLSDTASARIRSLMVGDAAGTDGEVNVGGTSSLVSQDFDMFVGNNGTGRVNINGGSATFNQGWVYIGQGATGDGTLTVNSGSFSSNQYFVGQSGTGAINVAGGTLTAIQRVLLGENTSGRGFVSVSGGNLNVNSGGVLVSDGGLGVLSVSGTGSMNVSGNFVVGNGASGTGHVNVTGGSLAVNGELWVGQRADAGVAGKGLMEVSAGSVSANNWIAVGRENGLGVLNIKGTGVVTKTGGNGSHIVIGSNAGNNANSGNGTVNILGGTLQTLGGGEIRVGEGDLTTAVLNVVGGTARADAFVDAGNGNGQIYLSGGTIKAAISSATFMQGLNNVVVGPGGATFDTDGNNVTVAQVLEAPTGNGVTTIPILDGGSGYVGQPIVQITGDGTGASAIANVVGGVITSVTITNPGIGYTTASVILHGGGATAPASLDTPTLGANVTTGGLTKIGGGTLTLTADGTYGGATTVNDGTLEFTVSQTLSSLVIGNGATVVLTETPPAPAFAEAPGLEMEAASLGMESQVSSVPEPGALGLLASGALGLLGRRRRTQAKV
jgi:autotransporter-associated beta strand protein/T5SS/PEP-CTERM-associated repeat protein